jgi:hypothetical protein
MASSCRMNLIKSDKYMYLHVSHNQDKCLNMCYTMNFNI